MSTCIHVHILDYGGLLASSWGNRGLSDFRIMQLETRANSETDNPVAQALYLSVSEDIYS